MSNWVIQTSLAVLLLVVVPPTIPNLENADQLYKRSIYEEIQNSDLRDTDNSTIAKLLNSYLNGHIVKFRSKVFNIHKRLACQEDCKPIGILQNKMFSGTKSFDGKFKIKSIEKLSPLVTQEISMAETLRNYANEGGTMVIGVENSEPNFLLIKLQDPPYMYNSTKGYNYDTSSISSTIYFYDMWVIAVVSGEMDSSEYIIRILLFHEPEEIVSVQLLKVKRPHHILLFIHDDGLYLLVFNADEHDSSIYCWRHTEFQACGKSHFELEEMKAISVEDSTYLFGIDQNRSIQLYKFITNFDSEPELKLHQVIDECSVLDMETSEIRGISFVAVACYNDDSKLFWWSGSQYLLWQVVPLSRNIERWTSLKVEEETFLISHSKDQNLGNVLSYYQFEEGYFRKVDYKFQTFLGPEPVRKIVTYHFQATHFVTVIYKNKLETFMITFELYPGEVQSEYGGNCYLNLLDQLHMENMRIEELRIKVERLINERRKQIEKLNGRLRNLKENVISMEISKSALGQIREVSKNGSIHVDSLIILGKAEIQSASGSVQDLDIVHLNKWSLSKTRNQNISNVEINGGIWINHLQVSGMLNGFNIKNNLATIHGKIIFKKPQIFLNSVHALHVFIRGKMNGISVSSVVLKNARQIIYGRKRVERLIVKGNLFLEKLNMVRFDDMRKRFVMLTGNQKIFGRVVFKKGFSVKDRIECQTLNEVHFPSFARKVLTVDTSQVITGNFVFTSPQSIDSVTLSGFANGVRVSPETMTILRNARFSERSASVDDSSDEVVNHFGDLTVDFLDVEFINGIHLKSLLSSLLRKSKNQRLDGNLKFQEAIFNEVLVYDKINNYTNLQDYFLTTSTDQTITTSLIFPGQVNIGKSMDFADGVRINGVDLSELDASCVKSGDQIINGHKEFAGEVVFEDINADIDYNVNASVVVVYGDLNIRENLQADTVNGFDVEKVFLETVTTENCRINGNVTFKKVFELGRFDWNGKINKVDIPNFLNNVIKLSTDDTITGKVVFEDFTKFTKDINVHLLNGKIFSEEMHKVALVDDEGKLTQPIYFRNGLSIVGDANAELLNGRDFTQFSSSAISKTKNQRLPGFKLINGGTRTDYLNVLGTINGVKASDLVDLEENVTFTNRFNFQSFVHFNSLKVDGKIYHGGVEVRNSDLVFEDDVHIEEIRADIVEFQRQLNGFTMKDVQNRILSKSMPQILNVGVILEDDAQIDELYIQSGYIENFNLDNVKLTENLWRSILDKEIFEDNFTLRFHKGLIIEESIEDRRTSNISWMKEFSGTINSDVVFEGNLNASEVLINGHVNVTHLEVSESINNIPITRFETNNFPTRNLIGRKYSPCLDPKHFSNSSDCISALQKASLSSKSDIEFLELVTNLEPSDDISHLSLGANKSLILLHHVPRQPCDKCSNLLAFRCNWESGKPVCNIDASAAPPGTYNVKKMRFLPEKSGRNRYTVFLNGGRPNVNGDCYQMTLAREAAIVIVQTQRNLLTSFILPTNTATDVALIESWTRKMTYIVVSSYKVGLGVYSVTSGIPHYKLVHKLSNKEWRITTLASINVDSKTFLFALNSPNTTVSQKLVHFLWEDKSEKLVEVGESVTPYAQDLAAFESSGHIYLIVAYEKYIQIHEFNEETISLIQRIPGSTLRVNIVNFEGVVFLTWVSEDEILHLWRWDHMLYAVEVSRAQIRHVHHVHAFVQSGQLWMALAVSLSQQQTLEGSLNPSDYSSLILRGSF